VIKPVWILALLGTAGVAGTIVVVSPSGEEEVVQQVETSRPAASGSPIPTPSSSPAPPSSTLTYTDPTYGYSFAYPASWELSTQPDPGSVILYSYDLASVQPEDAGKPVPPDKLKAFFWIAEGVDKPLEQWLSDGRAQASAEQNLPPPTVVSQSPAALADKQGLVEEIIESEGVKHRGYYIALGGGRVFVVNTVPADSQVWLEFESVLSSVRSAS
jgi:hypothetical protein